MKLFSFLSLPIRQKLMVIIMIVTAAALVLAAVGIMGSDSLLFRSYLERDIEGLAQITADNTTAAISFDDPSTAAGTLSALRARTHLIDACIYRKDGSILATYARSGGQAMCEKPDRAEHTEFTKSELIESHPIVLKGQQIGTLVMAYDLGEIRERQRLYGGTVLGVLLTSSLIAFLLSSRLRDTIAAPILALARTSQSVSEKKDYSIRAEKLSTDELGRLVDAFNEMLAGIQYRDNELGNALVMREHALVESRNSRDSLETTLSSIGDAVISTDTEGRVTFANRVALGLLRLPEDEVTGRPVDQAFRIIDESSRGSLENPLARVLRAGTSASLPPRTVLIAGDGAEVPIEGSGAPIRREGGPVQGAVLVFRDVSAGRKADETSRLLASIVESSGDAIIAADLAGKITSWNVGAERIFGYKAGEILGEPLTLLSPPSREAEIQEILGTVANNERVEDLETLRTTKSGEIIHVALTVSPIYDALGRVVGASKIARDITGRVLAAQRLSELNADLQETNEHLARSNEDLERFAFVASHDLQEPLRMITVYSQLLIRLSGHADEKSAAYVGNIVTGTQRMRELLADLLAYTEAGADVDQPPQPVDLNMTIQKVLENLNVAIVSTGATVTADVLPTLQVHGSHLVSLFQNLIGNAIKYRGTEPPCIHVSVRTEEHGQLLFSVSDNGIGIEPEYHDKIFVAFKRLHGKTIPGTGIGLAICQRVVERYGGTIWVESEPGRGSKFLFTLPGAAQADIGEHRVRGAANSANGEMKEPNA